MKLRTVIYTLLLATLCMGCGGQGHMRQLESLEAQLDTAPDVVRLTLDSIPFAALGDEATVCPQFVYTINGSTLSVSLTMTVWCDNVRLGDLDYSGTLMG